MKLSFIEWLREVDRLCWARLGLGASDLDDIDYRSLYDAGDSPKAAARQAIRYAKESSGL